MLSVGILGASGYAGAELVRLLARHSSFSAAVLCAESQAGVPVTALYPHLAAGSARFVALDEAQGALKECDLVFCALPHGKAMSLLPTMDNRVIIDLGGDFRLTDAAAFSEWYGQIHSQPGQLGKWRYGLPELFRSQIRGSTRIANPGCYATAIILALAPLAKAKVCEGPFVIDAMSGTSGAGRQLKDSLHFSHADENVEAYKIARHQHTPEIEMALEMISGAPVKISMTAHLVPMTRGIHATCSAQLRGSHAADELRELFRRSYADEPFVTVTVEPSGSKLVRGSNRVMLSVHVDSRTNRVIVTSVLDNLVKGAAGQALQNANLAFGFEETLGLPLQGLYP